MKKTALVLMAAGLGSRYSGGIKQLEPIGPDGEIIMDYSVHDAVLAGFNEIVFVIRREIEADFRQRIGIRLEPELYARKIKTVYVFQDPHDIPGAFPEGRSKPWGTGQAVLAARQILDCPFAVINADDFYGREAFVRMHDWLTDEHRENAVAMVGFTLRNTLSENGTVTRGICRMAEDGIHISDVAETRNILQTGLGITADGVTLDPDALVSMNMWGFPGEPPAFVQALYRGFEDFFAKKVPINPLAAEFLLPDFIGKQLRAGKCTVTVLPTSDAWFGVTYREDRASVMRAISELIERGVYSEKLYADIPVL